MLDPTSEVVPNISVADCHTAMRVLEAIGTVVRSTAGENDIHDSLNFAYAFINATVQHHERIHADFDNKPHGFGSL